MPAAGAHSSFWVVQSWGAGGLSFSVCSCSPCFCWAYVRLLLRCGTSLHDCQKVVAYPLLLARAVGVECSTSLPGGNQVDGLPPAPVMTRSDGTLCFSKSNTPAVVVGPKIDQRAIMIFEVGNLFLCAFLLVTQGFLWKKLCIIYQCKCLLTGN